MDLIEILRLTSIFLGVPCRCACAPIGTAWLRPSTTATAVHPPHTNERLMTASAVRERCDEDLSHPGGKGREGGREGTMHSALALLHGPAFTYAVSTVHPRPCLNPLLVEMAAVAGTSSAGSCQAPSCARSLSTSEERKRYHAQTGERWCLLSWPRATAGWATLLTTSVHPSCCGVLYGRSCFGVDASPRHRRCSASPGSVHAVWKPLEDRAGVVDLSTTPLAA